MRTATFREALGRFNAVKPFRPFTVGLITGVRLVAHHPEVITLDGDLALHVERDNTVQMFDADSVARLVSQEITRGAE